MRRIVVLSWAALAAIVMAPSLTCGSVMAQPFVYASSGSSDTLYVVDTASATHVASAPLSTGAGTQALVASNDGTRVYAATPDGSAIAVIDARTNAAAGTITVGEGLAALALSADGATLYAANSLAATLSQVSPAAGSVTRTQIVSGNPASLALSGDGTKLYLGHRGSTSVTVVTTATMSPTSTMTVGGPVVAIGLSSDDSRLYALDRNGVLSISSVETGAITTLRAVGSARMTSLAVPAGGARIVMTDEAAGTLVIVGATDGAPIAAVPVVGRPQTVAVDPSGRRAYVVGRDAPSMSVVDLDSATLERTIALPQRAERVAMSKVAPPAPTPATGWWWNPSEGGRGFAFETNAARLFFSFFLYAEDASPTWYLASGAHAGGYAATLDQYAGGQTLSGAFKPATLRGSAGSVRAVYFGPSNGTLVWPGGTTAIQRYEFAAGGLASGPASGMPETGWWWNPAEPGRGVFLEVQGTTLFLAMFLYDDRGEPVWYSSQNAMTSTSLFAGALTEHGSGQTLTGAYRAPATSTGRGTVTLGFSSRAAGTLTLPDGTQIPIQRFTF
jgi:DNA-binding beta-propeller fold protein YncE